MKRTCVVVSICVASVAFAAAGQSLPGRYQEFGDARGFLNILPPGSDGSLNGPETVLAQAGTYPSYVVDQLAMYDALVFETPGLTEERIGEFF